MYHREEIFRDVNGRLSAKIRQIWEILSEEIFRIQVHLFSNQATLSKAERERLRDSLARHNIDLMEHGLYELAHGVVRAAKPRFRKKLLPIAGALSIDENGHHGLLIRANLKDITTFLTAPETEQFDERLVWQNVRLFLGLDNDVNREIKATLLSESAGDFWFLNSGLTIVCDQIITIQNGHHPITLVNPQIVNGCQTASVLHDVNKNALLTNLDGSLSVKIIETTDNQFIERIALASNTQSRIFARDLRANDPIQLRLAQSIQAIGYFYRRKRGEAEPPSSKGIIDSARAGQLLLSYWCGEPTKSKTESNEIFGNLYTDAFNPHAVTAELIISAFKCYEQIEQRRQIALAWQSSVAKNSFEETWIIEGHFHVLFAVGELLRRRGASLTDTASAIGLVPEAMSVVQQFVSANPRTASYRLFRLASSREEVMKIIDGRGKPSLAQPIQLPLQF